MSFSNGVDKRRYLRYEVLDYAVIRRDGETDAVNAVIVDIGLGGLQVRSKDSLRVGDECIISVGLNNRPPLHLRGEVRHCSLMDDSGLFGSGIRFIPKDHADRIAIAEYVHDVFQRQCDLLAV